MSGSDGRDGGAHRVRRRHPTAPADVRWLVRTLEEEGFDTWAVGGAVRDVLLGHASVDWDFATRARPGQLRRLFRRTVPVGIEHGTVGVLTREGTMYEVTTFRKDVETFGRRAVVEFAEDIDDDLARRDFTINAIAWHPLRDELHDPFGGVDDLSDGLLRTVGTPAERFAEDYLRVLRALRFAGRFDLRVDDATWAALRDAVPRIAELSPERVRDELTKVLSVDDRPSRALELYREAGALEVVYPEIAAVAADPALWRSTLRTVDRLPPSRARLRLAALLTETGRPATVDNEADEPEEEGASEPPSGPSVTAGSSVRARATRRTAALMTRLRFSNADADHVTALVRIGPRLPRPDAEPARVRRWLAGVEGDRLPDVVRLAGARARVEDEAAGADVAAGAVGRGAGGAAALQVARSARRLRATLREEPPLEVGDLAIDGRDLIRLGLRPGPRFGEILDALLDRVLDDPELNDRETLLGIVREELAPEALPSEERGAEATPSEREAGADGEPGGRE